jgi:hypothetical protein
MAAVIQVAPLLHLAPPIHWRRYYAAMHWRRYALAPLCIGAAMQHRHTLAPLCIGAVMHWRRYALAPLCIGAAIHWRRYTVAPPYIKRRYTVARLYGGAAIQWPRILHTHIQSGSNKILAGLFVQTVKTCHHLCAEANHLERNASWRRRLFNPFLGRAPPCANRTTRIYQYSSPTAG